ncbi:MAG: hypothetical protein R3282_02650 [Rhodothermales bacterium]|nr:hypothetical protein [Rhodothermales bacterium]
MKSQTSKSPLSMFGLLVLGLFVLGAGSRVTGNPPSEASDAGSLFDEPYPLPTYVAKGLDWLASAQFENGGWGSGQHSAQHVRDPRAVQIDPATTAFAAMALMRAGSTVSEGPYHANVRKALDYLLELVESSDSNTGQLTTVGGTQPQAKLGQNIDVSMVAQLLARALPTITDNPELKRRVEGGLDKCVKKLEVSQQRDGSWNQAGWAPVLQSAAANSALEAAAKAGRKVDKDMLDRSREYQRRNVDTASGDVRTEAAAGISLYSIASNQRATAPEAKEALDSIERAKNDGRLDEEAEVTPDNLQKAGYSRDQASKIYESYQQNEITKRMLQDDRVLSGFGNNGGEEFLSYMMTSESLVVTGDAQWQSWYQRMNDLFSKVQNGNGSWSGHHCITSPVFCTAAVILTMTADRDVEFLRAEANG